MLQKKKKTHNETKQCRPQTLQYTPAAAHTFIITLPFTFTLTPLWHNTFGWSLNSQPAHRANDYLCAGKQKKKKCNKSPEENSFNDLPCIRSLLLLLLLLRVLCISSCLHSLAICCCSSPIAAYLKWNIQTGSKIVTKMTQQRHNVRKDVKNKELYWQ